MEVRELYTVTETPAPDYRTIPISLLELNIIQRIRQLLDAGCDIIIIEKRNGRPKVRAVGKPEG